MSGLAIPATVFSPRSEIAAILAREAAETLIGRANGLAHGLVRALLRPIAHDVAARFESYDRALGLGWASTGAQWVLEREIGGLEARGREHVPRRGPLLVVANHPGQSDLLALLAALGREDVWVVTADYPLLRALEHARRRFIFVPRYGAFRSTALRAIAAPLRRGECVILFPAGRIEVDPTVSRDEAFASIETWSRSVDLLARLAPETTVAPAVVRGVISPRAMDHVLARSRSSSLERQRMASLLQLASPSYRPERVQLAFAPPIRASGASGVHAAVKVAATALIAAQ